MMTLIFIVILLFNTLSSSYVIISDDDHDDDDDDDDDVRLKNLWLEDFDNEITENINDDMMQADSPDELLDIESEDPAAAAAADDDEMICPPPPIDRPVYACFVFSCESDKECKNGTKCCHNGCRYTCLLPVQPPSYVDWIRQPKRRLPSGFSWLIPGRERNEVETTCSTSLKYESDEDEILCPHGYVCHIEDEGNDEKGIPNSGRCVTNKKEEEKIATKEQLTKSTVDCHLLDGKKFSDESNFKYDGRICICQKGTVLCRVGKSREKMNNLDEHDWDSSITTQ